MLYQWTQGEGQYYIVGTSKLKKDIYVDDLLAEEKSIEAAITVRDEIIDMIAKGGFKLKQWVWNEPSLMDSR